MSDGPKKTGWEAADRFFPKDPGGDPAAAETVTPLTCAVCGAELEPDQTYCLECGSPTPLAPRLRRGGRTAAILAGAMVVLGLGAGALAFAVVKDDDGGSGGTTTLTSPTGIPVIPGTGPTVPLPPETAPTVGSLPADTSITVPTVPDFTTPDTNGLTGTATGFDTVTGPGSVPLTGSTTPPDPVTTPTTTAETVTQAPPTTNQTPGPGASDWPSGRRAWTAVLSSVRSESDARSAKGRVAKEGDPAGVFFSSDFPALRPGYWVVFSGIYASRNTAIAQAVKLRPDFPTAYARRIEG